MAASRCLGYPSPYPYTDATSCFAVVVGVVEHDVPGRFGDGTGELIVLITTITDSTAVPAADLAQAYH